MVPLSESLASRRDRLRRLINDLGAELAEVERLLQPKPRRIVLSRDFFWNEVYPLLKASLPKGYTNRTMQKLLEDKKINVESPGFRLFLYRMKKAGLLMITPGPGRYPVWMLTQLAREQAGEKSRAKEQGKLQP